MRNANNTKPAMEMKIAKQISQTKVLVARF
jgi:hypothetical protein